jgi:hypothetical protein
VIPADVGEASIQNIDRVRHLSGSMPTAQVRLSSPLRRSLRSASGSSLCLLLPVFAFL